MSTRGLWSAPLCSGLLLLSACPSSGPTVCGSPCGDGLTCLQNSDFPAGACTVSCTPGAGGCPAGSVCSPPLSGGSSYCLQSCGSSKCTASELCTTTALGQVCLPAAAAPSGSISCPAPKLVLGPAAGAPSNPGCQKPAVSSALPSGDVQQLGTHHPGESVSFHLPAGASGFSIITQAVSGANDFFACQRVNYTNVPIPSPLLTPPGDTFFKFDANILPDATTALLFYGLAGALPFSGALTFPNTSAGLALALDGGLAEGQWSFTVNDLENLYQNRGECPTPTQSNSYNVSVVVAPGPIPATGQLDVDLYLVTETLDAGTALTDATIQLLATRFAGFYAKAGICVSTMTLHDVPAWAVSAFASMAVDDEIVPCSSFRQMMTLAEPGRSMALFLVDELTLSYLPPGEVLLGIDGAIPGMATFNGTIAGGAAVSIADLSATSGCSTAFNPTTCGPDEVAAIAAHETGHFLGLYHPTESGGNAFDPLVDTAACVCALCETDPSLAAACIGNPDGGEATLVDETICSGPTQQCGGANLLMFWLINPDSKGDLTKEESIVMRANPLLAAP